MNSDIESRIELVFREVFDNDALHLADVVSRDTFEAWDSLGHVRLISALEEAFDLSFTLDEIEAMTSVPQIIATVTAKQ